MTKQELWQTVLAQIQLNISEANFVTWFKNTQIASQKKGEITVSVPNSFTKEWLKNKYHKTILKTLYNLDNEIKEVKYIVQPTPLKPQDKIPISEPATEQLRFQELKTDRRTCLNPRYSFENFIVGSFNELAHAAAKAVSENPGLVYNPLFIYGGVGLGKTHLLQAIGNEIAKNFKQKSVKYVPSEKFTSGVVSSIREQRIEKFKTEHKTIDILIIDDIQFLAGKEKTQEEFFHIFNALYEQNRQIIISSDRPPKAIPALAERLRSRFEGGMMADIGLPDFETRIAILKTKAQEKKIDFSDEVLNYIAKHIKNNIRELEGALARLAIHQKLNNQSIDLETTKPLLEGLVCSPLKIITPKKIIEKVSEFYDLKEKELLSTSRKKEIVKPRQIAMYLMRKELKNSYPSIGRRFGGKDHTTVIYACRKVSQELKKNERIEQEIDLIKLHLISA